MEEQRVEMDRRKASFLLSDGESLEGVVFLSHYKGHDSRPESVGEHLEREGFMPLMTADRTILLNVERAVAVKVGREGEVDRNFEALAVRHAVTVRMWDGRTITGDLFADLPEEACRVKDYLNQPGRFMRLFLEDGVVYLNRKFVLTVSD